MTTLGAAGLVTMIALADRRVIALLMALIGFLVSSWRQDRKQRLSLFVAFAQALRDIAVHSPSPTRRYAQSRPRHPRQKPLPGNRSAESMPGMNGRGSPGDDQHTKSSV